LTVTHTIDPFHTLTSMCDAEKSHTEKNCGAKRALTPTHKTEKVTFDMEQIPSSQLLSVLLQNSIK